MNNKLHTDWIHCEITSDTIEIHRGRGDEGSWGGQKGKIIQWSLPVLVEKNADEILNQVYNCRYWQPYGKGTETSKDSEQLRDEIWRLVMPHVDIRSMTPVPKIEKVEEDDVIQDRSRKSMNRAQNQGQYIDKNRTKQLKVIGSDECYTFVQSVEFVANWFLEKVDKNYFKNKVVYCNCDDTKSAFWIYFYNNFHKLGLKKLIASSFDKSGLSYGHNYEEHMYHVNTLFHDQEKFEGYIYRYDGKDIQRFPPEGTPSTFHGDFKEEICYNIAKNEADIIMTNPPFGKKWKQYVNVMLETGKTLIFWGNGVSVTYNWLQKFLDEKKLFCARECSHSYMTDYYMSPTYHLKEVRTHIYTTEHLSFLKPDTKHYSKKRKMLKEGTAWYDDNGILICDKATIPTDTNEILAVSTEIIRHGILNDGYEILKNYQRYAPIKDGKEKFARILIQKKTK